MRVGSEALLAIPEVRRACLRALANPNSLKSWRIISSLTEMIRGEPPRYRRSPHPGEPVEGWKQAHQDRGELGSFLYRKLDRQERALLRRAGFMDIPEE
jgi:hypothetical protein